MWQILWLLKLHNIWSGNSHLDKAGKRQRMPAATRLLFGPSSIFYSLFIFSSNANLQASFFTERESTFHTAH